MPALKGAPFLRELEAALEAIEGLRRNGARVHCITNTVAQNYTANLLLACGAAPSMTASADEAPFFTERAGSLLVNLGTLDGERREAIRASVVLAGRNAIPFVLDPVMAHVSPPRLEFAGEIAASAPAILRGNVNEIGALIASGRLASQTCVVRTGATDEIHANGRTLRIQNGHPMLARVIATGCAQGALMAALLAHAEEPLIAALAALLWMGVSGEIAAQACDGPGSFSWLLIDTLAGISPETIRTMARVT